MPFRRNRRSSGPGPNPGLTPIDDIHGTSITREVEPDRSTGRLPAQDDSESGATEKRDRIGSKKTGRKR